MLYQLFINNQWVDAEGGQTFESLNPFDGSVVASVPRGQKQDIDTAVRAARKAFDEGPWPRMTGAERAGRLQKLSELIDTNAQELVSLIISESGSTYRKAKGEVWLSGKNAAYFSKLAEKDWSREIENLSRPGVSKNVLVREPMWVCGQITPWNFPLQMCVWKIGAALATGNTVVLKPAEETPAVALFLARLLAECDFPPGVVNVVTGYGEEAGAALSEHPLVDKIAFTGSTEIGKRIMNAASTTLKKVTLELGGKSANIVLPDADMTQAVDAALYGAFFHTGQCCTAGTRLLLHQSVHKEFMASLLEKTARLKLGDPKDKATDMGPLVSKKQQETVMRYIEAGKQEGAQCVLGGEQPKEPELSKGCFVAPTIFDGVQNSFKIAQEEIFGPVLSVLTFNTPEEAVALANDSIYGLAGAVWSQNDEQAMAVARQLRAGTVWVNDYHLVSEKAPFGGYKQSGLGRELGDEGLLAYTELKHIHIDELKDRAKKSWYDVIVPK